MEPAFSAGDFRTLTALTLTGSWSNTLLFTAEVVVCIIYTRHWKLEQAYKHVVHAMLLNDSIASLTNYATVFLIFVYFDDVPWPVAMGFVANANSAFIGQAFLIVSLHRVLDLCSNRLPSVSS
ncbi:hypothetical protein B0H17DRAFT_1045485 [Mycena rosella]|uniref:Uncharacterized protein n=1 Tax=Mycena rosella TaxID=1033263 RepID=A0AAD7DWI4_MYCRO|nr:hypothetical protein B0H17DRAFT_1045485 [Mycena rosella]